MGRDPRSGLGSVLIFPGSQKPALFPIVIPLPHSLSGNRSLLARAIGACWPGRRMERLAIPTCLPALPPATRGAMGVAIWAPLARIRPATHSPVPISLLGDQSLLAEGRDRFCLLAGSACCHRSPCVCGVTSGVIRALLICTCLVLVQPISATTHPVPCSTIGRLEPTGQGEGPNAWG